MGCDSSKSALVYDSLRKNSDGKMFSDEELAMIKKTWRRYLDNDMVGNGIKVFVKIFDMAPFVKELFGFRSISREAMVQHPRFRLHAGRFMQAVGAAVENIHSVKLDEDVAPVLRSLGGRHQCYSGFDIDYIDVFKKALMEVWEEMLGKEFTPECQLAWGKIFVYVTEQFRKGYETAPHHNNNQNAPE